MKPFEKYAQSVTKDNLDDYINNPTGTLFLYLHPQYQLADGSAQNLEGIGADGNLYTNDVQKAPDPISKEQAIDMMEEFDMYFIAGGANMDLAREAIERRRIEEQMEREEVERQAEEDRRLQEELEFYALPFGF